LDLYLPIVSFMTLIMFSALLEGLIKDKYIITLMQFYPEDRKKYCMDPHLHNDRGAISKIHIKCSFPFESRSYWTCFFGQLSLCIFIGRYDCASFGEFCIFSSEIFGSDICASRRHLLLRNSNKNIEIIVIKLQQRCI
jgi:hypothetical protein